MKDQGASCSRPEKGREGRERRFGRRTAELSWLSRSVLSSCSTLFRDSVIEADFYPYVGLTHSIRRKRDRWVLRVSDHCEYAPRPVLEAIVLLLACKILRRNPPQHAVQTYRKFRTDPAVEESVRSRRRERGYKRIRGGSGRHHDLEEILQEVNRAHFNGQIEIERAGWGTRASWRRLGHYDPAHRTVTVSPVLDSARVPRYVVAYIVFHELLHALQEERATSPRHHPPEFRKAERAYPDFKSAKTFLDRYVRHCGRWPGRS